MGAIPVPEHRPLEAWEKRSRGWPSATANIAQIQVYFQEKWGTLLSSVGSLILPSPEKRYRPARHIQGSPVLTSAVPRTGTKPLPVRQLTMAVSAEGGLG